MNEGLGILIGVSKPDQVAFESKRPVSIGEYVVMNYGRGKVLGLVERSSISSDALGNSMLERDSSLHVLNYNSPGATGALPVGANIAIKVMNAGMLSADRPRSLWDAIAIAEKMKT